MGTPVASSWLNLLFMMAFLGFSTKSMVESELKALAFTDPLLPMV